MSNAIKTSAQQNQTAAGSTAVSDMLTRLGQGRGPGSDASQESFARWMTQHQNQAMPAAQASAKPGTPAKPAQAASPATPPRPQSPGLTAANRALASRQPTPARADGAAPESTHRSGDAKALRGKHEASRANRPASTEQKAPAEAADKAAAARSDEKDPTRSAQDEDVRFKTASGEGEAMVRELTPPPTVRPGDPAGMMAWLVSLTQADAAALQEAAVEGASTDLEAGADARLDGDAHGAAGLGSGRGHGLALGAAAGGAGAMGGQSGQFGQFGPSGQSGPKSGLDAADGLGAAALQADAMLGRGDHASGLDAEALSGFMAADGARLGGFGQTLAQLSSARHETATLSTPLYAPEFAQKLADQVSLWVGQARNDGPMTAELHLNPAEMGPINVKISLDGSAAHVDFAAAAQETRQAIESSLSMLSAALNEAGLSLSGGGVSSQTPQQQAFAQGFGSGQAGSSARGAGGPEGDADASDDAAGVRQVASPRPGRAGGLDLYA